MNGRGRRSARGARPQRHDGGGCRTTGATSSPLHPCMSPLFRFRPRAASVGEQVGEAQVFGQFQQVPPVLLVGTGKALLPTPDDVAMGFDTPGDLRSRHLGLLLEPPQSLREVVGDIKGVSSVANPLSRHGAAPPCNSSAASIARPSICTAFGSVCFRCMAYLGSGVIDPKSKLIR